ncbi:MULTISPECIES: ABC transporter ATP-binding protein [unclassified Rhodanobacter]|uniref:ABC transporter ATP-binding protein n=1 Tax=unclassified Rhodanobacter TaxID=2621553 RepID=UPI00098669DA|nr:MULTISPECIES: ABC transporter ATP-binding protein [unclassified Rhodanobacter]OOG38586.1 ABC transporter [Rhodanobacter sp. C05]OOG50075.1 ABC transporter [Rhodanobacter sp. C01]OOG52263.1 ABC transporter [Rhodanobacter sp. C03]
MENAAIQATGLTKSFGEGAAATLAVRGATFEAHYGEMLFIVGPSGSGKTTLLSMISGILRPSSGTVKVKGANLWQLSANDLAEFRLRTIGFVFQDFHLFPKLTTAENVAIPLVLRREDWNASLSKGERMLAIVGLKDRGQLPPVKLSGGEQQRVAIARALVGDPELLILDEPTASLDGDTGRMIVQFVREHVLNPTRCVLIVTHDARILEFADRVVHMEDGCITAGTEKAL